MKWKGRVQRLDLGSGGWALLTQTGETFELKGDIPEQLVGKEVRVEGRRVQVMGFLMTGNDSIEVTSIRAI